MDNVCSRSMCTNEKSGKNYCRMHMDEIKQQRARLKSGVKTRPCHCSLCGEEGHSRQTCILQWDGVKPVDRRKAYRMRQRELGNCVQCGRPSGGFRRCKLHTMKEKIRRERNRGKNARQKSRSQSSANNQGESNDRPVSV